MNDLGTNVSDSLPSMSFNSDGMNCRLGGVIREGRPNKRNLPHCRHCTSSYRRHCQFRYQVLVGIPPYGNIFDQGWGKEAMCRQLEAASDDEDDDRRVLVERCPTHSVGPGLFITVQTFKLYSSTNPTIVTDTCPLQSQLQNDRFEQTVM